MYQQSSGPDIFQFIHLLYQQNDEPLSPLCIPKRELIIRQTVCYLRWL